METTTTDRTAEAGAGTPSRGRAELVRGLVETLPLLAGVTAYGLVLGAQAAQKGLRLLEVPPMTGSNYAGGSEFAAIGLWASPLPVLLIAAVTLPVNSRHLIMGAALTPHIRHLPRREALAVLFLMSDEVWALGHADALKAGRRPACLQPALLRRLRRERLSRLAGLDDSWRRDRAGPRRRRGLRLRHGVRGRVPRAARGHVEGPARRPADLVALALTLAAATRLPMPATVAVGVASAGLLRHLLG